MSERTTTPPSALIVACAMSRFDEAYLSDRSLSSWRAAFREAANVFDHPESSIKMLRDEFDIHYPNPRHGWSKGEMRPPIRRTITEMASLSQDLHMELVLCALEGSRAELAPVTAMLEPVQDASEIAQRLKTGRLAEEWFQQYAPTILPPASQGLVDCRTSAKGFDFSAVSDPNVVFEVKGVAGNSGALLFTDREWSTALERQSRYWLAVVSNIYTSPELHAVPNPALVLTAVRHERIAVVQEWRASYQSRLYQVYGRSSSSE